MSMSMMQKHIESSWNNSPLNSTTSIRSIGNASARWMSTIEFGSPKNKKFFKINNSIKSLKKASIK